MSDLSPLGEAPRSTAPPGARLGPHISLSAPDGPLPRRTSEERAAGDPSALYSLSKYPEQKSRLINFKVSSPDSKKIFNEGGRETGGRREREGGQTELPGLHHVTYRARGCRAGTRTPSGGNFRHSSVFPQETGPGPVSVSARFFFGRVSGPGERERERERERNRSSPGPRVAPHYPLRFSPPAAREGGARAAAPPPPLSGGEISLRKT